jgi:hypothetical protein
LTVAVKRHRPSLAQEVEMKNRSSVRATRGFTLASLGCIISQFLAGSVALSQPFPSFILDTTLVRGPGLGSASGTRVGVGNGVNLVVWKDGASLCGARVNASGLLLDSLPIDIDGPDLEAFVNMRPQVAWSGSNFLVAWSNWDQTMFALVEPDGQVTLRKVLQDSVTALQSASAAVGFDGTNFLVAWSGLPNGEREVTFFCRVTPDGAVLDSPPRLVVPGNTNDQYDIAVGFHNDRYLAAWLNQSGTNDLWGSFIMPDGSIPDSVGFPIRSGVDTDYPCVTHDGHSFVVSWTEVSRRTVLARVTDQGLVLDTTGVLTNQSIKCLTCEGI